MRGQDCQCPKAWLARGWKCGCLPQKHRITWKANDIVRFGHRSKVYSGRPGDYKSVLLGDVGWHYDRSYVVQEVVNTHKCTCVRIIDQRYDQAWAPVSTQLDTEPVYLASKVQKRPRMSPGELTPHNFDREPKYVSAKSYKKGCTQNPKV